MTKRKGLTITVVACVANAWATQTLIDGWQGFVVALLTGSLIWGYYYDWRDNERPR